MKLNQLKVLFILFFILTQTANSQDLWATTGAEAMVSRNTSVYSIGQITYKDQLQKARSTMGDVQYLYEIFSLNLNENKSDVPVKLFPNPTSSYLLLEADNYKNEHMSYHITDMIGKVLDKGVIA
ncbi:MAG: hypothetical protein WA749_03375, partial [Gelidibacter sp.]